MNNGKDNSNYKENNLISKNNKHNKVKIIGKENTKWHSKIASGNSGSSKSNKKDDRYSGIEPDIDTTPQAPQISDKFFDILDKASKKNSLEYAKQVILTSSLSKEERNLALQQIEEYFRSSK